MTHLDEAHRRFHAPDDRRMVFILRRRYVIWLVVVIAVPILLAWLQLLVFCIHTESASVASASSSASIGEPNQRIGYPEM